MYNVVVRLLLDQRFENEKKNECYEIYDFSKTRINNMNFNDIHGYLPLALFSFMANCRIVAQKSAGSPMHHSQLQLILFKLTFAFSAESLSNRYHVIFKCVFPVFYFYLAILFAKRETMTEELFFKFNQILSDAMLELRKI